jgi:NO-binding membrane sensor protein with MHYT domain
MGIAIATSLATPYLRRHFLDVLPPELAYALLEKPYAAMHMIPIDAIDKVREIFANGYNIEMKFLIGIVAAQVPALALMWTNQVATQDQK